MPNLVATARNLLQPREAPLARGRVVPRPHLARAGMSHLGLCTCTCVPGVFVPEAFEINPRWGGNPGALGGVPGVTQRVPLPGSTGTKGDGMVRVRQLIALTGALVCLCALALLGAPHALAGGPTSVFLASPTSHRTAGLYVQDREYAELEKLLGRAGGELDGAPRVQPPDQGDGPGDWVNITWMMHDVTPWRQDRVVIGRPRPGDIAIRTAMGNPLPSTGQWHRAEQPARLHALLERLGVLSGASDVTGTAASPSASPAFTTEAGTADGTDWWWALLGLTVGVAFGAGGAFLIRRAAARHDAGPPHQKPRQS